MECELCGRSAQLVRAEIEGTVLSVCDSCAGLGRTAEVKADVPDKPRQHLIEESSINPGFAKIIKNARDKMTLEELGKKIGEKASVLDRVEKGMRPTDALARKLEKALKIKLLSFEE